jgi:hypothetical protein
MDRPASRYAGRALSNSSPEDLSMSLNGPYPGSSWPVGRTDDEEPYAAPADPWGDHGVTPSSSWGVVPAPQPAPPPPDPSGSVGGWGPPAAAPRRRNSPIVALVVVLGLLTVAGLGTTAWLLKQQRDKRATAGPAPSVAASPSVAPGSQDARFAAAGQCVVNQGTDDQPDMRRAACAGGTYQVLRVVRGTTSGARDAEDKCTSVPGYTNWFYYDSDLDDLDLVLCLKKR